MGLTIYYDWKTKTDPSSARRLIAKFRAIAGNLPFDEVSEIYEQDPPDNKTLFSRYDHSIRQGGLHLSRTRHDGLKETVCVPPLHALFFHVRVEGAETASIGLASHPPVVLHHEDLIDGITMVPNAVGALARAIQSNSLHVDGATIPGIRSARLNMRGTQIGARRTF